jgi:hypothetical protein
MFSAIMLNDVMLSVAAPSAVAPHFDRLQATLEMRCGVISSTRFLVDCHLDLLSTEVPLGRLPLFGTSLGRLTLGRLGHNLRNDIGQNAFRQTSLRNATLGRLGRSK